MRHLDCTGEVGMIEGAVRSRGRCGCGAGRSPFLQPLLQGSLSLLLVFAFSLSVSSQVNADESAAKTGKKAASKAASKAGGLFEPPSLKVNARIHTLWVAQDDELKPANEFSMDLARLQLTWEQGRWIDGQLQFDVTNFRLDAIGGGMLRDAYVRVAPLRALRFTAGQFKRPFSRFQLRSRGRIEVIERGIGNELLIKELDYGDRDIGLMLDGKFLGKRGIHYFVGVFNGEGRNMDEIDLDGSKDFGARIQADPLKWLDIGINASLKNFSSAHRANGILADTGWAAGADLELDFDRFLLWAEGMVGENYRITGVPYSWTAMLMALYTFDLAPKWFLRLQPVAKGEALVEDHRKDSSTVWLFTPGVNLLIGAHVRLMVDGEFQFVSSQTSSNFKDEMRLMVKLALDI